MPVSSLAERVGDDVRQFLLPVISGVTDQRTLFSLLLQDAEPCPWYRVNGAIRVAQVAYLASRLGIDAAQIIEVLQPLTLQVKAGLAGDKTPASYIEAVVQRAVALTPG
jgi:hypothetical protein